MMNTTFGGGTAEEMHKIAGLSINEWKAKDPILNNVIKMNEVFWKNPDYGSKQENPIVQAEQVKSAEERLNSFANYIIKAFPETEPMEGIIESPLVEIPFMQKNLEKILWN